VLFSILSVIIKKLDIAYHKGDFIMLVLKPDTKNCMAALLLKDTFDSFLFMEGDITTFNKFHIDGYLQKKFFAADPESAAPDSDYSYWKDVRSFCFGIIKGKHTPLDFKFVLSLPKPAIQEFLTKHEIAFSITDVQGLYLNFRYNGETLQCITGTSLNTFIPDKSLEHSWDKYASTFFDQHHIRYNTAASQ